MNNLSDFYLLVKNFSESHHMINEFLLLGSMKDLDSREFNYRSLVMIPSSSNISRDSNRPVYTLTFDCVLLDRCSDGTSLSTVLSTEENLFVIGQLQDFLIQQDENCYFNDVDVESYTAENDNINGAIFELTMTFARKSYKLGIDNA